MRRRTAWITAISMMALCLGACGKTQAEAAAPSATESASEVVLEAAEEAVAAETEEMPEIEETEEVTEAVVEETIEYPSFPLPEYHYYGPEDWADYGDAISQYMIENSFGDQEADLSVCTPVVLKVDDSDPSDVKVWGEYWVDQYQLFKTSLLATSGGSNGGVAHLDATGEGPLVTGFDAVEDGSGYDASIKRLFGAEGLSDAYSEAASNIKEHRATALSYYVNQNGLYITQFQDYGWPPVPIPNAPPTREEDQIMDYVSNFAYTTQFDIRQICVQEMDDCDLIGNVQSDDWNEFLITVSRSDKDFDGIISDIKEKNSGYEDWKEPDRNDEATLAGVEGCVLLTTPGPYEDGQKVFTSYLIPRDEGTLVIEISANYSADDEKQMTTDGIIEGFLGNLELK